MVYFADKKSTIGFCFVFCYCIVVDDDVNKQIGFYGNVPPSRKQCPLINLNTISAYMMPNIPYN